MKVRDRRQRVIETALTNPSLTYGQKVFMFLAATLKPEYIDGSRRHGSKAMGPDGVFSLHLDYLAKALGTSLDNAKKLREGCVRQGHLSLVHKGTFGRPSAWQALVVRGEEMYGVTFRQILPPYGSGAPLISGEKTSLLTYRDGTDPAPSASRGLSPRAGGDEAPRKERRKMPAHVTTACDWHLGDDCPNCEVRAS